MITFGELRKLSLQWQTDIAAVERVYSLDWLLKGIFERDRLHETLTLRGAAALSKIYFEDYPQPEEVDFVRASSLDDATLERELAQAAEAAARSAGLTFKLHSIVSTEARFEYTGPLGRRSAAQPRLPLRFYTTSLRAPAVERPLLHPFSDPLVINGRAVSLQELIAERLALWGARPRAREVYDLWFMLTHAGTDLDRPQTRLLAEEIGLARGIPLSNDLDPAYRPLLERAWDTALKKIPHRPSFAQAEGEIRHEIETIL